MRLPSTLRSLPGPQVRGSGIALCLLLAIVASAISVNRISLLPPGIEPRSLDVAGASALVIVDRPRPLVSDMLATDGDYQTLQKRAVLLGSLMSSPPAMRYVARRTRIPQARIAAVTRITANVQSLLTEPDSERRTSDIRDSKLPYRLEIQPHPALPSLNVYAQAPTVDEAQRLADAAVPALLDYKRELAEREGGPPAELLRVEQVGPSRAAIINGGSKMMIVGLTFIFTLSMSAALLAVVTRLRRGGPGGNAERPPAARHQEQPRDAVGWSAPLRQRLRARARAAGAPVARRLTLRAAVLSPAIALAPGGADTAPAPRLARARVAVADIPRHAASAAGDWPHTTRVLPWMIAAMLAVLWLVPFNVIELSVSLPIDLTFDRLILPVIIGTWVLAIAAGGPYAPRVRITWIHVGVLAMLAFACLSLVLGARYLNQTLEFDTSAKKLALLGSYVTLFIIVASVVRPAEVRAFLTYSLVLATICAIGTIWEYRFHYNVFYSLTDQLLPAIFQVGQAESSAIDSIGRRVVRGPAELPLEAVAMVTMGLPIALVRLIGSSVTRERVMYGLAAALMLAAAIATYRKSAFIAPIAVICALAYFRRRELLRLAPLGVVVAVMIPILSPGALQSVAAQLSGDRLNVPTVNDRSSDYDAVRPDVWTNLAFGRGYGSYEHTSYRILDMELLLQLVEVGVLGLAAYLLLIGAIVAVARKHIRARGPTSQIGLVAAAAAIGFLVVSTLFDVMSFPHTPYLLLVTAGLLAAVVATERDDDAGKAGAWSS